jgi:hypothetical protein
MTSRRPWRRSTAIALLTTLALGVAWGCRPRGAAPAKYYSAMRRSLDSVEETRSGEWSTLRVRPLPDEPERVKSRTADLKLWEQEHPAKVRAARDYARGIDHGKRLGEKGIRMADSTAGKMSAAWQEGATWGNKLGLYKHALLEGDSLQLQQAEKELYDALGRYVTKESKRRLLQELLDRGKLK